MEQQHVTLLGLTENYSTAKPADLPNMGTDTKEQFALAAGQILASRYEIKKQIIADFKAALTQKGSSLAMPSLSWTPIGIVAGVLVAVIGISGVLISSSVNLKSFLPQNHEEISLQNAELTKLASQIKANKQKQETGRCNLESDLHDETHTKSNELAALNHRAAAFNTEQSKVQITTVKSSQAEAVKLAAETETPAKRQAEPKENALLAVAVGKLVAIPAGNFQMGSSEQSREKPIHSVAIQAFTMQEHEVTFAQWDICVAAGGCSHKPADNGWGRGDRPVIDVSYNDITQQFIPWLSRATGKRFRLPSEAEWEYAASVGNRSQYSWGNSIGTNRANCDGCGSEWDNSKTAPVKSFASNAYGLYDMHGNVWEWVQDCWNDNYSGAPSNGSAWLGDNCGLRVLRGGSWNALPAHLRSAIRGGGSVSDRYISYGFRLVQD